ncbi:hypothetical protein [Maribacter aquivivus]|uniref:hypothetical protein n=1 Tax=Maribacter aquivivus TaxID=228958 RepID=UPI0024911BE5|nr:hypothetical protein [Maribacter aquivivus]
MKLKNLFTKQFYIYNFYRVKRAKPLDYIFFDGKVFIILSSIFLIGLVFLFPMKIEFLFPKIENQTYILESLLRVISIFIGISFSFIILSFNVFYKNFGRYVFQNFFKIRSAKICLTLLISTIVLLIYTIYFFKETKSISKYSNFLFLFSIVLSFVSFFSVFPFFINLLRSSQDRKHISEIFKKLNKEEYVIDKFLARVNDEQSSFYHKDPISLINEIGLASIKDFDNNTFELINSEIKSFFKESVSNKFKEDTHIDIKELYYNFTELLFDFYSLSIKEKNEKFLKTIIHTRYEIESCILENIDKPKFKEFYDFEDKYKHWAFDFDTEKYLKKAIQFNEDEICELIISNYNSFVTKSIIKLYPKDIKYNNSNRYDVAQKSDIIFSPLRNISTFSEILLINNKIYLFKEIFTFLYCVEQKVIDIETTDATKCYLFNVIHNYKKEIYKSYLDNPSTDYISYLNFPFKDSVFIYEKIKCITPILGLLEIIDLLFAKDKLNNMVINLAKADMLHLINKNEFSSNLLIKLVNKFVDLSSKIKDSDSAYRKDIYLKLVEKLEIVNIELLKNSNAPKETEKKLKESIDSFKKKKKYSNELKKLGYISDERIT